MDGSKYEPKHFLWTVEDRVATLTLNRPDRKNPLTFDSYAELRDTFRMIGDMDDVRAVMLRGAGGNFCSGGDVHEIIGPLLERDAKGLREFTQMTGDVVIAMQECPKVIVAAIDGVCVGAGAVLAMASDMRLGTARSKVAFLFVKVGLAGCDMGSCAMLPRIIGHGRAAELLYTGRVMTGSEAGDWGFYNRVVEPDDLAGDARALAVAIAEGPTRAHAMTKEMLLKEWDMRLPDAINAEAEAQARCMQSNDFRRAYEAFVAKRKPEFEGD